MNKVPVQVGARRSHPPVLQAVALSFLIACAFSAVAFGQATVRDVKTLPSYKDLKFPPLPEVKIPNPETFTLPNGIRVYLLENHELPLVSGVALVRTGGLFDPSDKKGLAELTGSVLRTGGTKTKSGDEIDRNLEDIAASVESSIGESSGTLNFSALKENTAAVLAIWRDFLENAEFRQDKVDLAKTQVRSGIARRNDEPSGIAGREFSSLVYGKNTPFGWDVEYADVDRIQREDLVNFYRRYYFPANIMVGIYGDFNSAEMRQTLTNLLGSWNYQQQPVPKFPSVSAKPSPGVYLAEKADVTQTFFEIGHLGGLLRDKDYAALDVAAQILGSGFTSRLVRRVRTQLGYAYNIGAGWGAGFENPGLFDVSGSTKSKSTTETIEVVLQEIEKLRTAEVTPEELQTSKDAVLNSFVFNFDRPSKTLNRLMLYDYFGYPKDFIFQFQKAVGNVTRADVLRVSKQYLKPENLTIVAVGNPKEFGAPLANLHLPVRPLDITIPEPSPAKAAASSPASVESGRRLLEKAQAAVGGAVRLASIKDLSYSADLSLQMGDNPMKANQRTSIILPNYFRQEQQLPFGKIIVYSDGKTGWMSTPQGTNPMPEPVVRQVRGELFRFLPSLLLSDRAQDRTVNDVGNGTVEISGGGENAKLQIDEATGLPRSLTYQSVGAGGPPQDATETYADWRDVDGIKVPYRVTVEQAGKKAADLTITEYRMNAGTKPEELSRKP